MNTTSGFSRTTSGISQLKIKIKDEPKTLSIEEEKFLTELKPDEQLDQISRIVEIATKNPIAFFNTLIFKNKNLQRSQKLALFTQLNDKYSITALNQCIKNMD